MGAGRPVVGESGERAVSFAFLVVRTIWRDEPLQHRHESIPGHPKGPTQIRHAPPVPESDRTGLPPRDVGAA